MEVQQGNRNHSLKREKPARCAGIPLEPLNECCLAVKRMPLGSGEGAAPPLTGGAWQQADRHGKRGGASRAILGMTRVFPLVKSRQVHWE